MWRGLSLTSTKNSCKWRPYAFRAHDNQTQALSLDKNLCTCDQVKNSTIKYKTLAHACFSAIKQSSHVCNATTLSPSLLRSKEFASMAGGGCALWHQSRRVVAGAELLGRKLFPPLRCANDNCMNNAEHMVTIGRTTRKDTATVIAAVICYQP